MLMLALIFILLATSIEDGKSNYKVSLENAKIFQKTEALRVKHYLDYTYYGWYGVALMLVPGPCGVITPGIYNELNANINSGERLSIHNQLKGRNLFFEKKYYMDFSGLVMLLGSLISLVYGFGSLRNRQYLLFLTSLSTPTRVVISIIAARILLVSAIFICVASLSLRLLLLDGINLFNKYYLYFLITALLIFILFLLLGAVVGTLKNKITGVIGLCAVYFILVFLLPLVIIKSTQFKADSIQSAYKTELENLKLVMNFEEKALKEAGHYSETQNEPPSEKTKGIVKEILHNEFITFRKREENTKIEILDRIKYHHGLSSFFPISFYISVCNEIGSKGYLNFIDFYSFTQKQKARFIDYYVLKKFYPQAAISRVESFIKGDENLFFSTSRLPLYFERGIALTILYILLLALLVFYRFKSLLARGSGTIKNFAIDLQPGKLNMLLTDDPAIRYHPYGYFSGACRTPPIMVNGLEARERGFIYLPDTVFFPDTIGKVIHLLLPRQQREWRKFIRLKKPADRFQLLETLLLHSKKTGKVIIFDDFFTSLKKAEIEKIKKEIAATEISSLYITKNEYMACSIVDNMIFCSEDESLEPVKTLKTPD